MYERLLSKSVIVRLVMVSLFFFASMMGSGWARQEFVGFSDLCSAADDQNRAHWVYAAYNSGLHLGNAHIRLLDDGDESCLVLTIEPAGVLSLVGNLHYEAQSRFRFIPVAHAIEARNYQSVYAYRDDLDTTAIAFGDPIEVTITPPRDDITPVPAELLQDVMDPLAAFVPLAMGPDGCVRHIPIFDSRRRYDVTMRLQAQERLEGSEQALYEGIALRCRLEIIPVAGLSPEELENHDFWSDRPEAVARRQATIWLAPDLDAPEAAPENARAFTVPVKLSFGTRLGPVILHLQSYGQEP